MLTRLIADELSAPAPSQASAMASAIGERHADAVVGILFYGSCLRKQRPDEGVLDFYVLVRSYRAAYRSWLLARANSALPPNVFYLEVGSGRSTIRAKYAVISIDDFEKAARPACSHAIVWGRFSQPALLVYAAGEPARRRVADILAQACVTFVERTTALLVEEHGRGRVQSDELWQRGFAETYGTELRPENVATIRSIYEAAPDRYDRVAAAALATLAEAGVLRVEARAGGFDVSMDSEHRRRLVVGWRRRRSLAKGVYLLRLIKSALTFGDWLPYALWKLDRHTGETVELTERQRRHPLIFAWPVIWRLLRRRTLR